MITAIGTVGVASGHANPSGPKVLSVCEVLGEATHSAGTAAVVVGRLEQSASMIDRQAYLSQDHCEFPIVTNEHVWPNRIQIWVRWESGMPNPPEGRPKTTKLRLKSLDGWAAVYGRIVVVPYQLSEAGTVVRTRQQPYAGSYLGFSPRKASKISSGKGSKN